MTERSLIINTSPHLRHPDSVPKIMYAVLLSLLPAVIASIYFFRFRAVALYLACLAGALATEAIFLVARK